MGVTAITYLLFPVATIISAIRDHSGAGTSIAMIAMASLFVGPFCAFFVFLVSLLGAEMLTCTLASPNVKVESSQLPESLQVCETHGLLTRAERYEQCPICKGALTDKKYWRRLEVERIAFAVMIVFLLAVAVAKATPSPDKGVLLPWQPGATVWNALGLALGFIVVGYAAGTFLLQLPLWSQLIDIEDEPDFAVVKKFRWSRLFAEFSVSLMLGILTVAGWFAYWTIKTNGQAWK